MSTDIEEIKVPDNYLLLTQRHYFRHIKCVIVTNNDCQADKIFDKYNLKIKHIYKDLVHPDYKDFRLTFIKFDLYDAETFVQCMNELDKQMQIIYSTKYLNFKKNILHKYRD